MGTVTDQATVIAYLQVRVMILSVGYPGHRIDKGDGLVKILEAKLTGNGGGLSTRFHSADSCANSFPYCASDRGGVCELHALQCRVCREADLACACDMAAPRVIVVVCRGRLLYQYGTT